MKFWKLCMIVSFNSQSLLETPSGPIAPVSAAERALPVSLLRSRSRSRSPQPKAAPNRPGGSVLLSERGSTGLAAKSCSPAPPQRSGSSSSLLLRPLLLWPCRACERGQRGPPCPRLVSRLLTPVRLLAGTSEGFLRRRCGWSAQPHAGTRSGRCGVKFSVKHLV